MRRSAFLFAVAVAGTSHAAAPQTLELNALATRLQAANAFDLDPSKPVPRKGGLLELKWFERRSEWVSCRTLAAKLQPSAKDLEGWVARTRLDCATRAAVGGKEKAGLASAFDAVKPALLLEGAWKEPLRDAWFKAGFALADLHAKSAPEEAHRYLERLLERNELLTKEQRASVLAQLGQLAAQKKDYEQAIFFLRQAEDSMSTAALQSKISELEIKRTGKKEQAETAPSAPVAGAEAEADTDIQKALAENRREDAIKRMVEILNRFPSGRFSKKYSDRVRDMLIAAGERSDEDGAKARAAVKDADPSRLAEWAGVLHRRGDDRGSLDLAEHALEPLSSSAQAGLLLYIAGRSASFLGDNEKASRSFDRLVQFHGAMEEASEALFRLGLIQIREQHYATAAQLFDKLLQQNRPRWDLVARYWRVRALEKTDKAKFVAERDDLIQKYPFTYYGLKLKAERENGVLEFARSDRSPLETTDGKLWLVGAQKKTWERFKKLSAEGWLLEAQAELAQLPAPQAPWALVEWARALAKAGQYPAAITLMSRALDKDETLRLPRYLEPIYPRAYSRYIEPESKEKGLDPVLVRSLIRQESAFGLRALSTSSAMGLMQMIPPTAREVAAEMKLAVVIPDDMYKPEVNVPMGTHYLAKVLGDFGGNVPLALASYNAGPHKVKRWIAERPALDALKGREMTSWEDEIWYDELPWSETSFYVKAILRNILLDRLIDQGRVVVTPSFWAQTQDANRKTEEDVKRR